MSRVPHLADEAVAAGAATPDEVQVAYLLRLLSQICHRTNLRIDMYQRGIAIADARGDAGFACAFRHLTHIAHHDRQILEDVIDRLQRYLPGDVTIPWNPSEGGGAVVLQNDA